MNIEIQKIENDLYTMLKKKDEAEIKLIGTKAKLSEASQQSELLNFFQCNKNVRLISTDNNDRITFSVKAVCENFNEEVIDGLLKFLDYNSFVYDYVSFNDTFSPKNINKLMKAIFVEKNIKLRLCAIYRVGFLESPKGLKCNEIEYENVIDSCSYLPNPHIYYFGCLGGYIEAINSFLKENDLIGAITQCIASCMSLNLYDTPVIQKLMQGFFVDKAAFLEIVETGELVKPSQAIKYLNEREV